MPTTPPSITPAPPAPIRNQKATFSDRVDAFVTWLVAAVAQFLALAQNVFNNATEAFQSATASANWAGISSTKAAEAAASATSASESVVAAAAAVNAPPWASGTTYQQSQNAQSKVNFKIYKKTTTAAANTGGLIDPANDPANWQVVGTALMPRSTRISNVMLGNGDIGAFIDITAGTFTQTFDSVTNLANGWYCYIRNSGTGDITIPASDGRTNWIMYPGEVRVFQCDGTTLLSFVIAPFKKVFVSTATWIKPPGYPAFDILEWGGAGSGAAARASPSNWLYAGGGGGGAFNYGRFPSWMLANSVAVTVGAGGSAVNSTVNDVLANGVAGGTTSFGTYLVANGGGPGIASNDVGEGGAGGTATTGAALATRPEAGTKGGRASSPTAQDTDPAIFAGTGGAAARARLDGFMYSTAGVSKYGGTGGAANTAENLSNATDGTVPAGGGAGCATRGVNAKSGAGARGEVRVEGVL